MDAHGFEVAAGAPPVLPAQTLTANQPPTSRQPPAAGLTTPQKGQSRVRKHGDEYLALVLPSLQESVMQADGYQ